MILVIEDREYEVTIQPGNCESLRHRHDAPHADGSPGQAPHHHHAQRCGDLPLNATLRPVEKFADPAGDLAQYEADHPHGTFSLAGRPR